MRQAKKWNKKPEMVYDDRIEIRLTSEQRRRWDESSHKLGFSSTATWVRHVMEAAAHRAAKA